MKKPKPIGFVVSAIGIGPERWCVARQPDNILQLLNWGSETLRTIRAELSTTPLDISLNEVPVDHRGKPLRLRIKLDSLEQVPVGEYIDTNGGEVPASTSAHERFYLFVMELYLGGRDRRNPIITIRVYLHPDEQQMGPFYLDDRGLLYREVEYAAYEDANNPLPEEMRAIFAGARAEIDADNAATLLSIRRRLEAFLDLQGGAPHLQKPKSN